jgi:SAM-dependent methyltransferase
MEGFVSNLLEQETHFAFGKNWLDYAEKIDEVKVHQAMADLKRLNGGERLDGKTFLDIGCGSGLHALAAIRLGARSVSCVDIDPDSVQATKQTLDKFAPDIPAKINVVSVFDLSPEKHGTFDVVYSWGVLHHTGDMYRAIKKATDMVASDGIFMIALYKKTIFCGMWRVIKKWYASAPESSQITAREFRNKLQKLSFKVRGRDFESYVRNYSIVRGMNFNNDVHDWMGGFPYESISPNKCKMFFSKLDFQLINSNIAKPGIGLLGSGCDEYTFKRCAE